MNPSPTKMKELIDNAPGSLLVTDRRGKVVYANDRVSETTGFSLPEIIGREPGRLWGGRMPKHYYSYLWETIGEQKVPFVGRVTNERKKGGIYEDTLAILPLLDETREPEFFVAMKSADGVGTLTEEFRLMGAGAEAIVPDSFTARFFQWLGTPRTLWPVSGARTLAQFIRQILVAPLEERFIDRSEDYLLIRNARENPEAFRLLYEKYHTLVFGYFLRHLSGDRALSEDLTQDTFFRAFRHLSQFREANAAYGTYLMRIAHNLLVNYYRREKTATLSSEEVDTRVTEPLRGATLDDRSLDWLWESRQLTVIEREILTQFYQRGLSVREIASMLEKSENAVKLHLSRGRQKLRQLLGS